MKYLMVLMLFLASIGIAQDVPEIIEDTPEVIEDTPIDPLDEASKAYDKSFNEYAIELEAYNKSDKTREDTLRLKSKELTKHKDYAEFTKLKYGEEDLRYLNAKTVYEEAIVDEYEYRNQDGKYYQPPVIEDKPIIKKPKPRREPSRNSGTSGRFELGILGGAGVVGTNSRVIYDTAYPDQKAEEELTFGANFGMFFIYEYVGYIECGWSRISVANKWIDSGHVTTYSTQFDTYDVIFGFRVIKEKGNAFFLMPTIGLHYLPEPPEIKATPYWPDNKVYSEFHNRLNNQFQASLGFDFGYTHKMSNAFVTVGIRVRYIIYLYSNDDLNEMNVRNSVNDSDFVEISPVYTNLFVSSSVRF